MTTFPEKRASDPTSLLWAYQLRREHNALMTRIIAVEETNVALETRTTDVLGHVDESKAASTKLAKQLTPLVAQSEKTQSAIDALQTQVEDIETRLNGHKEALENVRNELKGADVQQDSKTSKLAEQMLELERKLDETNRLVKDSAGSRRVVQQSRQAPHDRALSEATTADVHDSGSLDLDDGMLMELDDGATLQMDTLKQIPILPESLAPIPELDTQEMLQNSLDNLKQGESTLSDFLHKGTDLVREFLRRKEGIVVNAFVDGMAKEEQKQALETWLDGGGWYWHRAESYVQGLIDREQQMVDATMQMLQTQTQSQSQRVKEEGSQLRSQRTQAGHPAHNVQQEVPRPRSQKAQGRQRSQRAAKRTPEAAQGKKGAGRKTCDECRARHRRCNGTYAKAHMQHNARRDAHRHLEYQRALKERLKGSK